MKTFSTSFVLAGFVALTTAAPISFEARAGRVPVVVEALSKQTGQTLTTSPEFAREVVAVHVTDVPLDALLDRIARTVGGEWVETSGGGRRLERGSGVMARLFADETVLWEAALKVARERVGKEGPADPEAVQTDFDLTEPPAPKEDPRLSPESQTALQEFAEKTRAHFTSATTTILGQLTPAELARMPLGGRIVLSSSPTALQRGFSGPALRVVTDLNTRIMALAQEARTALRNDPAALRQVHARRITRALLLLERTSPFEVTGHLYFVSESTGMPAEERPIRIDLWETAAKEEPATEPFALKTPSTAVNLQAAGGLPSMVEAGNSFSSPEEMMRMIKQVKESTAAPDRRDPMSLSPTEGIFALAKDQKADLVAVMPETWMGTVTGGAAVPLKDIFQTIARDRSVSIRLEEGWLTVEPKLKSTHAWSRFDRVAFRRLMDQEKSEGHISLAGRIAWALTFPEYVDESILYGLLMVQSPSLVDLFSGTMGADTSHAFLRFFNALTPLQRQALARGETFALMSLTPPQRALATVCLHSLTNMEDIDLGDEMPMPFPMPIMPRMGAEDGVLDYTDVAPTQLSQTAVSLSSNQDQVVKVVDDRVALFPMPVMDAGLLGFMRAAMTMPQAAQWTERMPRFERFRIGNRTTFTLALTIRKDLGTRNRFAEVALTGPTAGVPEQDLPAEFRKKMAESAEKAKELLQNFGGGSPIPIRP